MIEEPRQKADIDFMAYATIIACAFVGLGIFSFSAGYDVGKDIALGAFQNKG